MLRARRRQSVLAHHQRYEERCSEAACALCDRVETVFSHFGCAHAFCDECMFFLTTREDATGIFKVQCPECCLVLERSADAVSDNYSQCQWCRYYLPSTNCLTHQFQCMARSTRCRRCRQRVFNYDARRCCRTRMLLCVFCGHRVSADRFCYHSKSCVSENYFCRGCDVVMTRAEYAGHYCKRHICVPPIEVAFESNADVARDNEDFYC